MANNDQQAPHTLTRGQRRFCAVSGGVMGAFVGLASRALMTPNDSPANYGTALISGFVAGSTAATIAQPNSIPRFVFAILGGSLAGGFAGSAIGDQGATVALGSAVGAAVHSIHLKR